MSYEKRATLLEQGWRNRGDRGDRSPGPHKFFILEGTEGDPIFLKMGPFDWHCAVFRQFAIFAYTVWALLALGALFRKGPQGLVPPPPRNSFLRACSWGLGPGPSIKSELRKQKIARDYVLNLEANGRRHCTPQVQEEWSYAEKQLLFQHVTSEVRWDIWEIGNETDKTLLIFLHLGNADCSIHRCTDAKQVKIPTETELNLGFLAEVYGIIYSCLALRQLNGLSKFIYSCASPIIKIHHQPSVESMMDFQIGTSKSTWINLSCNSTMEIHLRSNLGRNVGRIDVTN